MSIRLQTKEQPIKCFFSGSIPLSLYPLEGELKAMCSQSDGIPNDQISSSIDLKVFRNYVQLDHTDMYHKATLSI